MKHFRVCDSDKVHVINAYIQGVGKIVIMINMVIMFNMVIMVKIVI